MMAPVAPRCAEAAAVARGETQAREQASPGRHSYLVPATRPKRLACKLLPKAHALCVAIPHAPSACTEKARCARPPHALVHLALASR